MYAATLTGAGLSAKWIDGDNRAPSPTDIPTPGSESPRVTDRSFEILNTCGSGGNHAIEKRRANHVVATGTIRGSNTYQTAELTQASDDSDADELTVAVPSVRTHAHGRDLRLRSVHRRLRLPRDRRVRARFARRGGHPP